MNCVTDPEEPEPRIFPHEWVEEEGEYVCLLCRAETLSPDDLENGPAAEREHDDSLIEQQADALSET